jgi:hypothetical protein
MPQICFTSFFIRARSLLHPVFCVLEEVANDPVVVVSLEKARVGLVTPLSRFKYTECAIVNDGDDTDENFVDDKESTFDSVSSECGMYFDTTSISISMVLIY